jgi:outer membrane protein assembly factor BamD
MRSRVLAVALLALTSGSLLCLCACEGEGPRHALGYTEDAKRSYDAAMAEYNSHHWISAQQLLREIKRKYSYSKYARLAELRIADSDFEQEKYADCIREYKDFIHAHRSDAEEVGYARARIAESTYSEIPDTVLVGAPEERDQGSVVDAYKELTSYLADYPDGKEAPHVHDLLTHVISRLVRHELYVARFYLRRGNYEAAVARVQYALRTYSGALAATSKAGESSEGTELAAQALLLLGETYMKMRKFPDARQTFESIVQTYTQSPIVLQARDYLLYLHELGA